MTYPWTDARLEQLRVLWAQGLSAAKIAIVMDCPSRNAIIGKVHRLGLEGRDPPPSMRNRVKKGGKQPVPPVVAPKEGPVSFAELARGECQFALGDNRPFLFCGKPVVEGGPYCPEHRARCYQIRRPRQDPKQQDLRDFKPKVPWVQNVRPA